ncbi:MAG TPA: hypothetical protein VMS37_26030 [Verrucomicrobiae bacterium]|nr:hypothetical protein [Verrucomicrobiae bacterium]
MKRASSIALFAAIAVLGSFAQTRKDSMAAAGIANSYVYISPGTAHEWQTWRRSLYAFAPLLFR